MRSTTVLILFLFSVKIFAQNIDRSKEVWVSDNGNGTFTNPVLYTDYSDPDAIRVGDDYYLTASSFNCVPGLPILHSKDLVNWRILGYAFAKQKPYDVFSKPQHGNGVWAPAIRYHNEEFYIFYPDPDFGIYVTKAKKAEGPWTDPVLMMEGKGYIDPCPLWDEDGKAYLVHGWAGSRAGAKSFITLRKMSADGLSVLDDGVMVFDGHGEDPTVEGPKIYKRNGYYYIMAPAGGVKPGWQLVLRSKNIYGPYEKKVTLAQGNTPINGPHQGAWLETQTGESWFFHFQDVEAYGRVVHLQPVVWKNDWPVMGNDPDGDGKGEPVITYKKPNVGKTYPISVLPTSDEFNEPILQPQWQWHANNLAVWGFPTAGMGYLRLVCIPKPKDAANMWDVSNLLLQKFTGPQFTSSTKLTFFSTDAKRHGEKTGLIVMGEDYAYVGVRNNLGKLEVIRAECFTSSKKKPEIVTDSIAVDVSTLYFKVQVDTAAQCQFSYSTDNITFSNIGKKFQAKPGRWIGAKVGLFAIREGITNDAGYVDIDWFRFEK